MSAKSEPILLSVNLGTVSKFVASQFGLAFLAAKDRSNARTRHGTFDTSVVEVNKEDLTVFLEQLQLA